MIKKKKKKRGGRKARKMWAGKSGIPKENCSSLILNSESEECVIYNNGKNTREEVRSPSLLTSLDL